MYKIGHRGAAGYEVENTERAIERALEMQVDMIELDVRRCATGELVVFHDSTVRRILDRRGAIKKMKLERLKELRTADGQAILTLKEALDIIDGRCWVNLHLKTRGVADKVVEIIKGCVRKKHWKLRQFLVSSFNHAELKRLKNLYPAVQIGLLYYRHLRNIPKKAEKLAAYSVHFDNKHLRQKNVEALRKMKIKTFVWTVNAVEDIKRLYKMRVDGIISDYPDII